jgi:hypothetical protein
MKLFRFAYFRVIKNATYLFCANYTDQNPSLDADCFLASQGIYDILWNLRDPYHAYGVL